MRIAVCDPDSFDRELTARQLRRYCGEHDIPCHLRPFSGGVELIHSVEQGAWFDAVILECCMEPIRGIDAARELRLLHYRGAVVFLCARADFAVEGYEVGASGYLLKPLCYGKLCACLDRLLQTADLHIYQVCRRGRITHIAYGDITYVESCNSKCVIHLRNAASCVVYKKLGDIEQELNDKRFLRCHQSYLVNMDYICQVDKQFHLCTGEVVLIRQHGLRSIRKSYLEYRASLRG